MPPRLEQLVNTTGFHHDSALKGVQPCKILSLVWTTTPLYAKAPTLLKNISTIVFLLIEFCFFLFLLACLDRDRPSSVLVLSQGPPVGNIDVLQHKALRLITTEPSVMIGLQNMLEILELKPAVRCMRPACPNLAWILHHSDG